MPTPSLLRNAPVNDAWPLPIVIAKRTVQPSH